MEQVSEVYLELIQSEIQGVSNSLSNGIKFHISYLVFPNIEDAPDQQISSKVLK